MVIERYRIDVGAHEAYARTEQDKLAFQKQYHIPSSEASYIDKQTRVADFIPKHLAETVLLQTFVRVSWPHYSIPPGYYAQHFFTSHIAPSLGPPEKQDADIEKIDHVLKTQTDVTEEGQTIITMLSKGVKETNEMVDFVLARMKQFIQA